MDFFSDFGDCQSAPSQKHGIQLAPNASEIRVGDAVENIVEAVKGCGLHPTDLEQRDSESSFEAETQYEDLELHTQGVETSSSPVYPFGEYMGSARKHSLAADLSEPKTIVRPLSPTTGAESGGFKFDRFSKGSGCYSRSYPVNHMHGQLKAQIFVQKCSPNKQSGNIKDVTQLRSADVEECEGCEENMAPDSIGSKFRDTIQNIEEQIKEQQHQQFQNTGSEEASQSLAVMELSPKESYKLSTTISEISQTAPSVPFPEYTFPKRKQKLSEVREKRQRKSATPLSEISSNSEQARLTPTVAVNTLTVTPPPPLNTVKMFGQKIPLDYETNYCRSDTHNANRVLDEYSKSVTSLNSTHANFVPGIDHSMQCRDPNIATPQKPVLQRSPLASSNQKPVGHVNSHENIDNAANRSISRNGNPLQSAEEGLTLSIANPYDVSKVTETQSFKTDIFQSKSFSGQERFHEAQENSEKLETQRNKDRRPVKLDELNSSYDESYTLNVKAGSTGAVLRPQAAIVAAQLVRMCQEQSEKQQAYVETIQEREQTINDLEEEKAQLLENSGTLRNSNRLLRDELRKVKQKSRKYAEHINQIVQDQKTIHNEFKRLEADAKNLRGNFTDVEGQCKAGEAVIAKYRQLFFVDGKKLYSEAGQRISDLEESLRILHRDLDSRLIELQRERGLSSNLQKRLDENSKIQEELNRLLCEYQSNMTVQLAGHQGKIMNVLNMEEGNQKRIEECVKLMNAMKSNELRSPPALEKLAKLIENLSESIEIRAQVVDERSIIMREEDMEEIETLKKQLKDISSDQKIHQRLNDRVAELIEINASLKNDVQTREASIAEYQMQIEKYQNDLGNCHLQLKAKSVELNEATAQVYDSSRLRNQVHDLEASVATLTAALSTANEDAANSAELIGLQEISTQSILKELENVKAKLQDAECKVQTFETEESLNVQAAKIAQDKFRIAMEIGFQATLKEQQLKNEQEKRTLLRREADAGKALGHASTELVRARELLSEHEQSAAQLQAELKALQTYDALYTANIAQIENRLAKAEDRYACRDVTLQVVREELLEDLRLISELENRTSETALTIESVRENAINALHDLEQKVEARASRAEISDLQVRPNQNETILEVVSGYLRRLGVLTDGVSISEWANSALLETPQRRVHFEILDSVNIADDDIQSRHFLKSLEPPNIQNAVAAIAPSDEGDHGPDNIDDLSLDRRTKSTTHDHSSNPSRHNSSLVKSSLLTRPTSSPHMSPQLKIKRKDEIPESQDATGRKGMPSRGSSGRLASHIGRTSSTSIMKLTRDVKMKQTETTTLTTEYSLRGLESRGDSQDEGFPTGPTSYKTSSQKDRMEHAQSDIEDDDDDNLSGMTEMSPVIDYITQHPSESYTEVLRQQQGKKVVSKQRAPTSLDFPFQQHSPKQKIKNAMEDHLNAETSPSIIQVGEEPIEPDQHTPSNRKRVSPSNNPRSHRKTIKQPQREIKSILKPISTKLNATHQPKEGDRKMDSSTPDGANSGHVGVESVSSVNDLPAIRQGFATRPYNRVAIGGAPTNEASIAPRRDDSISGKADKIYPFDERKLGSSTDAAPSMTSQPERNRKRTLSESWSQSERLSSKRISIAPLRRVVHDSRS